MLLTQEFKTVWGNNHFYYSLDVTGSTCILRIVLKQSCFLSSQLQIEKCRPPISTQLQFKAPFCVMFSNLRGQAASIFYNSILVYCFNPQQNAWMQRKYMFLRAVNPLFPDLLRSFPLALCVYMHPPFWFTRLVHACLWISEQDAAMPVSTHVGVAI